MREKTRDDRGAVLVLFAISLVGLLALAGLVIDGGRAYGERRQMQNAADASAMAATRQLDQVLRGVVADAGSIDRAARDAAERNGADRATVSCQLVRFDRVPIGPCPTGATLTPTAQSSAAGVKVLAQSTKPTVFMRVVDQGAFTATADATAQIGRPGGTFTAPFIFCGTAPGHNPRVLVPSGSSSTGFAVNPAARGTEYQIYGNAIKSQGRDCGNPSSSFRGNANRSAPQAIPGEWDSDTGNANGPTLRLVSSGNVCTSGYTPGCVVVLPLCPRGNGRSGTNFRTYCTDFGLFEISYVANHDIRAYFRGAAALNQGAIVGPADANGARIVALTD